MLKSTPQELNIERWFSDDEPTWIVGKRRKPPQTAAEAMAQSKRLCKTLHRLSTEAGIGLAAKLAGCAPENRCQSGACPVCIRAAQRWFVASAAPVLAEVSKTSGICCVSIIPANFDDDGKPQIIGSVRAAIRQILTVFRQAGIRFHLGGLDISYNEVEGDKNDRKYKRCVHIWGFLRADELRATESFLRRAFYRTEMARRTFMSKAFDGNPAGIAYVLKNAFVRRMRLSPDENRSGRFNTRDKGLLASQKAILALRLDKIGLSVRLLSIGVEIELFRTLKLKPDASCRNG